MHEFFKPLRRKLGVVTLVMGCIFTTEWVRSPTTQDTVTVRMGTPSRIKLVSVSHQMIIAVLSVKTDESIPNSVFSSQSVTPRKWIVNFAKMDVTYPVVDQMFFHNRSGFGINNTKVAIRWLQLPYWSSVIPLTLLTAWLLLSRPRQKTNKITSTSLEHANRSRPIF